MRALVIAIAAFGLAACDSGNVPSPVDRMERSGHSDQIDEGFVALHGEGIVAGAESFYFAAGRSEVERALEETLGAPLATSDPSECGAGPIASSTWPSGLTVNFQQGNLAGWRLEERSENIQVDADIAIATPRDEARSADGFTAIEGSMLGDEFALGDRLGGVIEDGEVSMIYAGAQCFAR